MSTTPAEPLDQTLAGQIFNSGETRENLEILCDDFGSRFAGTESEKKAAGFLQEKLQEYGLEDVHTQEFEYNGWTRGTARLSVKSPWQRDLNCLSMPMSPPGKAAGKIVDLGNGAPEQFDAMSGELQGNIALVSIANPVSAERWIHRVEKYNRTLLAGASAFIFMGNEPGYGPVTGALGFNRWGLIPGIMVSKETGLLLRRLIHRHGSVAVEVETSDSLGRKTSWNIIGDIRGRAAGAETVVIGAHYDGHDLAQGAEDPTSGLVAALEVARTMALCADRLKRNLRFVLFGVEELGLIGSSAYVEAQCGQLDHTRFMFNLDGSGRRGTKSLFTYGPDTRAYFQTLAADLDEELIIYRDTSPLREPEHISADHYPFMVQGIPCGFIRDPDLSVSTGFYHTAHDTVDKVHTLDIKEAAFLCARLAWRVANDDDWPFARSSQEDLDRARAEYDKSEVMQIEKAVEALRRQRAEVGI